MSIAVIQFSYYNCNEIFTKIKISLIPIKDSKIKIKLAYCGKSVIHKRNENVVMRKNFYKFSNEGLSAGDIKPIKKN